MLVFSGAACKAEKQEPKDIGTPPVYSEDSDLEFEYFAYHSMNDGKYMEDGKVINTGKDYRDPEHFRDYVDAGMKTFFFQQIQYQYNYVRGGAKENFAESDLKKYMDMAQEAGVEKAIVLDWRILRLSSMTTKPYKTDDLTDGAEIPYVAPTEEVEKAVNLGLNKDNPKYVFAKKSELRNYVISCIKEYEDHDIFWAVLMRDEPTYKMFPATKAIFEIVREYNPEIVLDQNLLPMYGDESYYHDVKTDGNLPREEFYKKYLENWLDASGADYVMFDTYPIRYDGIETFQLKGLKIAAEVCKERGAELKVIMQTFAWLRNGKGVNRLCDISDLYWQTNMLMGYGCTEIVYYTYFTIANGNEKTGGMYNIDGASFVNHYGEKTEIYYDMKKIMAEMQKFAKVILNFKYRASGTFKTLPLNDVAAYDYAENDEFAKVKGVAVEQGDLVLVNELYDAEKGNYMYMVENILDPIKGKSYDTSAAVEIEFDESYEYVAIYYKDSVRYEKLTDHKYSTVLSAGYAEFLLPY